jgi:single-strand DNA-binding protein
MAQGVNKVTLLGFVGKNPEIRSTTGGTLVANFSVATTERYKDRDGKQAERTEWHNIVAFARTAEIVRDYAKKGTLLYLEGKLETKSWDDKETGHKNYRTQIVISRINLLPSGAGKSSDSSTPADSGIQEDDSMTTNYSDEQGASDIPF